MNAEVKEQVATRNGIVRVLRGVFQEWVFQLALVGVVFTAVLDGVAALNRGTIV